MKERSLQLERSVTEAMANDDVELISRAPYIAIKNREIEDYR